MNRSADSAIAANELAGSHSPPGPLGGKTILRFAHAYDINGGTERYLDDLDRALLERSALTIIRLYLTRSPVAVPWEESPLGLGSLVRVRLPVIPAIDSGPAGAADSFRARAKQRMRDWLLYQPWIWRIAGARWTKARKLPRLPGQAIGARGAAAAIMGSRRVDLVMMHFFGGRDAEEVMEEASRHRVPVALLNHYANDRYLNLAMRKHALVADAACGVNGLDVPSYLRPRFTKLSDGVDPAFFQRSRAAALRGDLAEPIILLPARVVREKGALDLVRAAAALRTGGIACSLALAGPAPASDFLAELVTEIDRLRMTPWVRFLGAIAVEALRDWYAGSTVVALPTYHHEGLPRVIIEAQAMGTPVIAYATGGVPDAIVQGVSGILVPTGDLRGLVAGLGELLQSGDRRSAIARGGRASVERQFSLEALAARHEAFYLRLFRSR